MNRWTIRWIDDKKEERKVIVDDKGVLDALINAIDHTPGLSIVEVKRMD